MNTSELQRLRIALLQTLRVVADHGLPLYQLVLAAKLAGFPDAEGQVKAELQYLADKGLVATMPKLISPEVKSWRITASGRDFLAEEGL